MKDMDRTLKISNNSIYEIKDILSQHGKYNKIIYISEKFIDCQYGDMVKSQLTEIGIVKEEMVDNNTISYAMSLAETVIATDVDLIVGIGGGKVLDVCKYAAYISKRPLLSIATTLANDGVASPIAVLKRKDGRPKSLGCATPTMLIIDTNLIMKAPRQLIKAGVGDTISNYMALLDWEFACKQGKDEMNGYAYMMSRTSLDALMTTQYDHIGLDFITVLANSLVLSGIAMDFAGSSRPVSGSEHLISHALDYYTDTQNLHGIQVALGTITMLNLIGHDDKLVKDYLKKFEVDIKPRSLGISKEDFVRCIQNASKMRVNRYTYLDAIDLETKKIIDIYNMIEEEY